MSDQEGGQFVWLSQQWLSGLCVVTLNPKWQTVDWEIGQLSRPVVIPPFLVLTVLFRRPYFQSYRASHSYPIALPCLPLLTLLDLLSTSTSQSLPRSCETPYSEPID